MNEERRYSMLNDLVDAVFLALGETQFGHAPHECDSPFYVRPRSRVDVLRDRLSTALAEYFIDDQFTVPEP